MANDFMHDQLQKVPVVWNFLVLSSYLYGISKG